MSDLNEYIENRYGICVGNVIISHLLWADDLVLISSSATGLQKIIDGLEMFCADNKAVVNKLKTKCMVIGKHENICVKFNDARIEQVTKYKYLGNIISAIETNNNNIFHENISYLDGNARRAIFGIRNRIRDIGQLSPLVMLHLFETLVKPIITYGSEIWGILPKAMTLADKLFLQYTRNILNIKTSTSNIITYGECGKIPPSCSIIKSVSKSHSSHALF